MSVPEFAGRDRGRPSMKWFVILVLVAIIGALLVSEGGPLKIKCWKAEHITEQVAVNAGCLVTVRGL